MAVTRKFRVHLGYEVPNLPNRQWNCIKDLIPPAKTGGRPRTVAPRQVINAIFSIVVSGIQWRMLPKDYPRWKTVYYYFRIWRDDGTWQRIHDTLRAAVRRKAGRHTHPTAGCLDSQSVKSTQIPGIRGHDAGKKVTGRKRHILVDTMGLLIIVVVTAASVSDPAGARLLFSRLGGAGKKLRRIWVDGTYRGKLVDWVWTHCRVILQPVLRFAAEPDPFLRHALPVPTPNPPVGLAPTAAPPSSRPLPRVVALDPTLQQAIDELYPL